MAAKGDEDCRQAFAVPNSSFFWNSQLGFCFFMGKKKKVADSGLKKCATGKHPREDRISLLPDEILICILSSLTFKEACRTSVLSKRWISVWANIPRLDFDASTISTPAASSAKHEILLVKRRRDIVTKWVNKAVSSRNKALALDEFRVYCDLDDSFKEDIDKWLQFAFSRKVGSLELNLIQHRHRWEILHPSTYTFPCEKNLVVDHFKSLKALSLTRVDVSGEVLKFFLQNCKFLERLAVHFSMHLTNLEVSGPSLALQHLQICMCYNLQSLIVRNANLISLGISNPQGLVLEDVPMLVDVQIFSVYFSFKEFISLFSCCLSKLKVLNLSFSHEHIIEQNAIHRLGFPQLTGLKQLTIVFDSYKDVSVLDELISLIQASPNLENFVMKVRWVEFSRSSKKLENICSFGYPIPHLKVVEFYGYTGRRSDEELVRYLVKNAVSLEKIVIDCHCQWYANQPWNCNQPKSALSIRREKEAERYTKKQQLEKLIPSNVELIIV